MKKSASLSASQFSDKPTELDHMIEGFVSSLDFIAANISSILFKAIDLAEDQSKPIISVASRLAAQSTKFESIMMRINDVHSEIGKVQTIITQGTLMYQDTYNTSRDLANAASQFIETSINKAKDLLRLGSPYKEAYDQMTIVAVEYVQLLKMFNEVVASYNELHSANLAGAKTDLLTKCRIRTVSKGVNFKTGEGMRTSFDSWEDMEQYMDKLIEEDYDNELDFVEPGPPRTYWNYRVLEEVKNGLTNFTIIEVYCEDGKI